MKKFYLLFTVFLTIASVANSQGVYQIWGATTYGGPDDKGAIFSTRFDGTGFAPKHFFTVTNSGAASFSNKPVAFNGKLYGVLYDGGPGAYGIIGEYDPLTNVWTRKVDLHSINAIQCPGYLTPFNGKLYGVAHYGGDNMRGLIFEYDPATNSLAAIYHFSEPTGGSPTGSLVVFNNKFYGTTYWGGTHDFGVVFEFDPATTTYSKKADFDYDLGGFVIWQMTVYDNKLWGTSYTGGENNMGTLFCFDPATSQLTKKIDFDNLGHREPGPLTVYNNKLYGATGRDAVIPQIGGIFEYNPATNLCVIRHAMAAPDGHSGIQMMVYNNKLYGTSVSGGGNGRGCIFTFDPLNGNYQTLYSFNTSEGTEGAGGLMFYGGKLYGFSRKDGNYGSGSLFSFNPLNNNFSVILHFGGTEFRYPYGPMVYQNYKIYGTVLAGGTNGKGGIYEYDPATGFMTPKIEFGNTSGYSSGWGGMTAYNNKFYGVMPQGGTHDKGVLYEYDPAANTFSIKHHFDGTTGGNPYAPLTVFNNKLYGACADGSTNDYGNLFEFDPATSTYTQKVVLSQNWGGGPIGKLTVFNNKLYGVCRYGGTNSTGTLFEYTPGINAFVKKYDFPLFDGTYPSSGLTEYNGKLYGITYQGGASDAGVIYEYNPATGVCIKRLDIDYSDGQKSTCQLMLLNGKLYGMLEEGGADRQGLLFEFDPVTSNFLKREEFNAAEAGEAAYNGLITIPAPASPGTQNACHVTQTVNINAANANEWIAFTDEEGRAVAEINANGNILGYTSVSFYVYKGATRQDASGRYYLDRNITVHSDQQPSSPVSVRLYFSHEEFLNLKSTPGSGVVNVWDLAVFRNGDDCQGAIGSMAGKLTTTISNWGADHVASFQVNSFSSFYFASNNHAVLPVHILSFNGNALPQSNRLEWEASCTNGVTFTLERSEDGMNYKPIGIVLASQEDCEKLFKLDDNNVEPKRYFYRLHMKEDDGVVTYSHVVVLDRRDHQLMVRLSPNPATGSVVRLEVQSAVATSATVKITDANGRTVYNKVYAIVEGANQCIIGVEMLPAGIYLVRYEDGQQQQTIKLVKNK